MNALGPLAKKTMEQAKPAHVTAVCKKRLLTIGYEGRSISEYCSILQDEKVEVVVDVRKHPISRKKGFSKTAFSKALHDVGISYIHLPGFGIESKLRKNLATEDDYKELLSYYETEILPKAEDSIAELESIVCSYCTVALTCFERDPVFCHRTKVANNMEKNSSYVESIAHL